MEWRDARSLVAEPTITIAIGCSSLALKLSPFDGGEFHCPQGVDSSQVRLAQPVRWPVDGLKVKKSPFNPSTYHLNGESLVKATETRPFLPFSPLSDHKRPTGTFFLIILLECRIEPPMIAVTLLFIQFSGPCPPCNLFSHPDCIRQPGLPVRLARHSR